MSSLNKQHKETQAQLASCARPLVTMASARAVSSSKGQEVALSQRRNLCVGWHVKGTHKSKTRASILTRNIP